MVSAPAAIAAEQTQARLNVALSAVKQANDTQQAVAEILQETIQNAPVSSTRGTNVNISA